MTDCRNCEQSIDDEIGEDISSGEQDDAIIEYLEALKVIPKGHPILERVRLYREASAEEAKTYKAWSRGSGLDDWSYDKGRAATMAAREKMQAAYKAINIGSLRVMP